MTIRPSEQSESYFLSEEFIGGKTFEIDGKLYAELNDALTTIVSAMDVEELFQVFVQSFLRFEKDLLEVAFEYAYTYQMAVENEEFFKNIRHRFNVNIITILTSYRSYDDHCGRIFASSSNLREAEEFNNKTRREIFDTHLSYRICAELRNYAQHRQLPLDGFTIGGVANIDRDNAGIHRKLDTGFNVSPWLDVAKFTSSSQCKTQLKKELGILECAKIDMKWLIRSFVRTMYKRHAALREFLTPKVKAAGEQVAEGYGIASAVKGSEAKFLGLHRNKKNRNMRKDLSDQVLKAFRTYASLEGAEQSYVTSRIRPEKATYTGYVDA